MRTLQMFNLVVMGLFFLCYSYQFFYIPVALLGRRRTPGPAAEKRYAVLIAARNEQSVVGQLIDSIREQDYPRELVDVYVVADNCTDATAAVAEEHGAVVYERFDRTCVGKGYALNYLLNCIDTEDYDGFFVFDADNILAPDYIRHMNETFSQGCGIVTSYRNSKNYGDNWISAGYALWFIRDSRYLNHARMLLGSSCVVAGTGFLFSRQVLERCGGWNFFLLTEDTQFTIHNVLRGERIGYCPQAMIYDEQPRSFRQSWRQRMRWCRGYMQVFSRYGKDLLKGVFGKDGLSCYDMTMSIMPAAVLSGLSLGVNLLSAALNFLAGRDLSALAASMLQLGWNLYITLFLIGALTTVTEWKHIHCPAGKKILYAFTFPIFMFTYVPICIVSLFTDVQWQPIRHDRSLSLEQIRGGKDKRVHARLRDHTGPAA